MITQRRTAALTLAFSFVGGALLACFIAWLLVPAQLPVDYLTPIVVSGPFVGLAVGRIALVVRRDRSNTV